MDGSIPARRPPLAVRSTVACRLSSATEWPPRAASGLALATMCGHSHRSNSSNVTSSRTPPPPRAPPAAPRAAAPSPPDATPPPRVTAPSSLSLSLSSWVGLELGSGMGLGFELRLVTRRNTGSVQLSWPSSLSSSAGNAERLPASACIPDAPPIAAVRSSSLKKRRSGGSVPAEGWGQALGQ